MAYMCLQQSEDSIPSAPVSNYDVPAAHEGDDLLPFVSIIAQSRRVKPLTPPTVIDLTRDDTDVEAEVGWHRKRPQTTPHHVKLTRS
jgi:hypothetical protein